MLRRYAAVFVFLASPCFVKASGIESAYAVFAEPHPVDLPAFYSGHLGLIGPAYAERHLIIAYRWMDGLDVTPAEARLLETSPKQAEAQRLPDAEIDAWQRVRRDIGLPEIEIHSEVPVGEYEFRVNCTADGFTRAARKAAELISEHGKQSPHLAEWMRGQDAVFANCSREDDLPGELPAEFPAWLRDERDYQRAAALFYRGDYSQAATQFASIAASAGNPRAELAAYLVARCKTRMAEEMVGKTAPGTPTNLNGASLDAYNDARQSIAALVARGGGYPYRLAASQLDGQLEAWVHPQERAQQLNRVLLAPRLGDDAWNNVWDYAVLAPAWAPDTPIEKWIRNFATAESKSAAEVAVAEWNRTGKVAWLLAALRHAASVPGDHSALLKQAAEIPRSSPIYLSVGYYRAKTLANDGRAAEARELVTRLLSEPLDPGARNLLLDEAAFLAPSLPAFAAVALQRPLSYEYEGSENGVEGSPERWSKDPDLGWRPEVLNGTAAYFSPSVAEWISGSMPFEQMWLLPTQTWPAHIRRDLLITIWARGLLLDRVGEMNNVAAALRDHFPRSVDLLREFEAAKDPERRRFLAMVFLLRTPGANPILESGLGNGPPRDALGAYQFDRWWNAYECNPPRNEDERPPLFLTREQVELARKQLEWICSQGAPATFTGKVVVPYVRAHPREAYAPEALHLVVRASRYGERDCATGAFSRQAYSLLQQLYRGSSWQNDTPNWYEYEGDCSKAQPADDGSWRSKARKVWSSLRNLTGSNQSPRE